MVDVTTARGVSPATTLDASIKRQSSSHPERTHDTSAETVVCTKMKVEENPDDSSHLCGFLHSKDVQILVTCSDTVAPIAQRKDNPHALCTNFISSGFGPWCQNLEVKMSRRCTSLALQATNAVTKEKTCLGSGVTWRRGAGTNARNTKTKSGFNLQQLLYKDKGSKADGVFDRRPSSTPCAYVFRHHDDISDYISDYRLHHTLQRTSTRDRYTSVSSCVPSISRLLKEKKLCRFTSSCSSAGTSSTSTRSDSIEKKTRSVPNLAPVREKTTEPDQKGRPKANKAGGPSTDQPSKSMVQCLNNNGPPMEDDNGRQPRGTSLTSQQSSGTKTNALATKCTSWPTSVFPSLHKLVTTKPPSDGGRAGRKACKIRGKQSKPRSDACDKLKQDSKKRSLNENIHHTQREETSDDGDEEGRMQNGSNTIALATTDKNNSRCTEGPGKGDADHPYLGYSSFPEVTKHQRLSLMQMLQGDGARVAQSVTRVDRATGGSHHVWRPALTRSVHESWPRLQVTDPAKVKNTPENIASQLHDWLRLGQCVSFPELRLSKPQITASTSGEVSDMTRRHKRNRAGVCEEGLWGGRDWVAHTQAEVATEATVSEESRNKATSDGDRGVHGPLNVSTSDHKHTTQKAGVDRGGKWRLRDRSNAKRRTFDHLRAMGRAASSQNTPLSVVARSLGVGQARNREQRMTGSVHLDFRVSKEAVQRTVAEVTT